MRIKRTFRDETEYDEYLKKVKWSRIRGIDKIYIYIV